MKKKISLKFKSIISGILVATLVITCFSACKIDSKVSVLKVTGDVKTEFILSFNSNNSNKFKIKEKSFDGETIKFKDKKYKGILLSEVLETAETVGDGTAIFHGIDGVMTQFDISDIDETCFLFVGENGWQFNSTTMPKQTGIKNIDTIVVKTTEITEEERCFRTIYEDLGKTFSFGELFLKEKEMLTVFEGQPILNGKTADSLTKRELISFQTLFGELSQNEFSTVIGYFENGDEKQLDNGGYIEWRGNKVDYIGADKKTRIENLSGVWFDPPKSVTAIKDMVLSEISNKKVMLIELDGLGFYSIIQDLKIAKNYEIEKMRTVLPSISNVALASILSGKLPIETEITSKSDRDLQCDDIFDDLKKLGKSSVIIEGNSKLIDFSIDQILNVDTNGDGTNDDEMFESAMKNLGNDFVFVHFHGFDDVAHSFSPSSVQAKEKLETLWEYVENLAKNFDGSVYVTADHGQRDTLLLDKKGSHGNFLPKDMTVPFIKVK